MGLIRTRSGAAARYFSGSSLWEKIVLFNAFFGVFVRLGHPDNFRVKPQIKKVFRMGPIERDNPF